MFIYDKKLQYPVKIARPNPRLAAIIISQYGGPDGELGASLFVAGGSGKRYRLRSQCDNARDFC